MECRRVAFEGSRLEFFPALVSFYFRVYLLILRLTLMLLSLLPRMKARNSALRDPPIIQ